MKMVHQQIIQNIEQMKVFTCELFLLASRHLFAFIAFLNGLVLSYKRKFQYKRAIIHLFHHLFVFLLQQ